MKHHLNSWNSSLLCNTDSEINRYVNPIGIDHVGWKFYFLYEGLLLVQVRLFAPTEKFFNVLKQSSLLLRSSSSSRQKVRLSKRYREPSMAKTRLRRSRFELWWRRKLRWPSMLRMFITIPRLSMWIRKKTTLATGETLSWTDVTPTGWDVDIFRCEIDLVLVE